jgi:phosphinothricin acetyltransferase
MSWSLRVARVDDAAQCAAIYAPIVRETATSFELVAPDAAEMATRITTTLASHPWLVADRAGEILGYAYASRHRTRAAYQWCAETSIYVAPTAQRLGVGQRLYERLLHLLRQQGIYNAYAGITLPNAASVGLHEAMGFRPIGIYPRIGFKLGAWHDVGWWEMALRPHESAGEPEPAAPGLFALACGQVLERVGS